MATINQEKVFERVISKVGKGEKVSVSREMRNIYSESYAHQPHRLTRSDGWQELCDKYGLTDEFLLTSLAEDIEKKPQNRKAEIELALKTKGRLKQDAEGGGDTHNHLTIIGGDQTARIARRALARLAGGEESSDRLHDSDQSEI